MWKNPAPPGRFPSRVYERFITWGEGPDSVLVVHTIGGYVRHAWRARRSDFSPLPMDYSGEGYRAAREYFRLTPALDPR